MKVQVKDKQGIDEAGNKHRAPCIADGTHECELKWEMKTNKDLVDAGIDKEIKWEDVNHSFAEELRKGIPDAFRQKWVLAEQDKEKPLPPLIQHLADAIEAKGLKVTFGLQPEHYSLIESGLKEGFTNEYLFEKIGKQIGWEKYTLACWYIKHLCQQTTTSSTRIAELSARVAELEGVLKQICNLNWEEGSDLQIVTKMYDIATNALKNQQP